MAEDRRTQISIADLNDPIHRIVQHLNSYQPPDADEINFIYHDEPYTLQALEEGSQVPARIETGEFESITALREYALNELNTLATIMRTEPSNAVPFAYTYSAILTATLRKIVWSAIAYDEKTDALVFPERTKDSLTARSGLFASEPTPLEIKNPPQRALVDTYTVASMSGSSNGSEHDPTLYNLYYRTNDIHVLNMDQFFEEKYTAALLERLRIINKRAADASEIPFDSLEEDENYVTLVHYCDFYLEHILAVEDIHGWRQLDWKLVAPDGGYHEGGVSAVDHLEGMALDALSSVNVVNMLRLSTYFASISVSPSYRDQEALHGFIKNVIGSYLDRLSPQDLDDFIQEYVSMVLNSEDKDCEKIIQLAHVVDDIPHELLEKYYEYLHRESSDGLTVVDLLEYISDSSSFGQGLREAAMDLVVGQIHSVDACEYRQICQELIYRISSNDSNSLTALSRLNSHNELPPDFLQALSIELLNAYLWSDIIFEDLESIDPDVIILGVGLNSQIRREVVDNQFPLVANSDTDYSRWCENLVRIHERLVDVDVPIDVDREDFGVQATDDLSVDPVELARSYSEQALKVLSTRALSRDDWGFIDYLLNQISYNRSTQIDRIRLVYQWADLDLPVEETFEYSIDGDEIGTIEPENLAEAVVARLLIGVYEQKQTLRSEGISLRAVLKGIQRFLEEGEEARNNPEDTVSPALEAFNRYSRELDLSIK